MNGAWDPKPVMIAKTWIYAAAAALFIHLFTHALPRRRFLAATIVAALFAFPFNFHNLLWALKSQFDFFLLCTATAWVALLKGRAVAALLIAGISLFTLGAGAILAASFVPFCLWAWRDVRWTRQKAFVTATAAVLLAVIRVSLRGDHAAPLATPREQAAAVATYLAWPHSGLISLVERLPETERLFPRPVMNFPSAKSSWLMGAANFMHAHPAVVTPANAMCALLLLAPIPAVALLVARRRIRGTGVWGALGLGGFAFLMQVATGVARAKDIDSGALSGHGGTVGIFGVGLCLRVGVASSGIAAAADRMGGCGHTRVPCSHGRNNVDHSATSSADVARERAAIFSNA